MPFGDVTPTPVPGPHPVDVREINPDLISYLESKWGIAGSNELEVIHSLLALLVDAVFYGRTPIANVDDVANAMIKEV